MRRTLFLVLLATALLRLNAEAGAEPKWAPWWNAEWSLRMAVEVVPPEARGGVNTALVGMREEWRQCAQGGADVRVVSQSGKPAPHALLPRNGEGFDIEFLLDDSKDEFYYVYYGNPKAKAEPGQWERKLGGLRLTTFRNTLNMRVFNWPSFCKAFSKATKYDSKEWGYIDDVGNPFGENDFYLSIYEGTFFCPTTGEYVIATNSDDACCVFIDYKPEFKVEDMRHLTVARADGVPSDEWVDPAYPYGVRRLKLTRGAHTLYYVHAENGGKQLARFGWQTPEDEEIYTVPPSAFVSRIPAVTVARQRREAPFNPYFTYEHRYSMSINNRPESTIPVVFFQNRTSFLPKADGKQAEAEKLSYKWTFSDGVTSEEESLFREFAAPGDYDVALEVKRPSGETASVSRHISLERGIVRPLSIFFQLEAPTSLIPPARPAPLLLQFKSMAQRTRIFKLHTTITDLQNGKILKQEDKDVTLDAPATAKGTPAWTTVNHSVPQLAKTLLVRFELSYAGAIAATRQMVLQSSDALLSKLSVEGLQLVDDAGRPVVLSIADVRLKEPRRLRKIKGRPIRVVVLDDSLAPPAVDSNEASGDEHTGYAPVLRELLEVAARKPVEVVRISPTTTGSEFKPPVRFSMLQAKVLPLDPDVVVICTSSVDVLDCVPPVVFESYLIATADQILTQTQAVPVLATPLPIIRNPHQSRPYAVLVKKAGLRKSIVVADLYSRFLLAGKQWTEFFRISGCTAGYWMWPDADGQELIAQELATAIIPILKNH